MKIKKSEEADSPLCNRPCFLSEIPMAQRCLDYWEHHLPPVCYMSARLWLEVLVGLRRAGLCEETASEQKPVLSVPLLPYI